MPQLDWWKFVGKMASKSSFRPSLRMWAEIWPTFCGPRFGEVSRPVALTAEGTLVVEVDSEAWLAALKKEVPAILLRIKTLNWDVYEIRLQLIYSFQPRPAQPDPEQS